TRGMVYRGPESTGREEWAIPNAAVDVLGGMGLIRAEARPGGEHWYELTHDRFVAPIKESNRVWKEQYDRWQRRWKMRRATGAGRDRRCGGRWHSLLRGVETLHGVRSH